MEDKYNIYVVGDLKHNLVTEQEMLDILLDYADADNTASDFLDQMNS